MEDDLLVEQIVVVNGLLEGNLVFVEWFTNVDLWTSTIGRRGYDRC